MTTYDLIVIGAGAYGSAAAFHAARRGLSVLLLEQFEINHGRGSSYGHSRIIRYAYDHPVYVELAKAAYGEWDALQAEAGEPLWVKTGGLDFGVPGHEPMLDGMISSLAETGIPHELLSPDEVHRRFPQFLLDDDMIGLYQADAGVLFASRCVLAHVRLARAHGADIREHTTVSGFDRHADSVTVHTSTGSFSAARLIIAAGAWARPLLLSHGVDLPLRPIRCQENYFSAADPVRFGAGEMPVFIAHVSGFPFLPYGLPSVNGSGFKIGLHGGPDFDPAQSDRTPDADVGESVRRFAANHLPTADGSRIESRVCLYTMTPDEHFIIDQHPDSPHVVIAACCSGHGFKFSTSLGRMLVDIAISGETSHDVSMFSLARFASSIDQGA